MYNNITLYFITNIELRTETVRLMDEDIIYNRFIKAIINLNNTRSLIMIYLQ